MMIWTTAATAVSAAFLSSLVEAVEAVTIVLAVATVRGWRPAALGSAAGLALLVLIVLAFGPLLDRVPLYLLQVIIGALLLLFGMRWLRKAILRAAGVIPLHDEMLAFAHETEALRDQARRQERRLDWLAGVTAFKAVVLEGLEVVFIVIAVGAGRGLIVPASTGALLACLLVCAAALAIHRPLSRVPENTLKFAVGVMLSAFGVFWLGEGLGVPWPGGDLAILAFVAMFLAVALAAVRPRANQGDAGHMMSATHAPVAGIGGLVRRRWRLGARAYRGHGCRLRGRGNAAGDACRRRRAGRRLSRRVARQRHDDGAALSAAKRQAASFFFGGKRP